MDEEIKIGESTYELRKANFMDAKTEAFKLTALLKGCFNKSADGKSDFDVGQLMANLNSKEMESVEKFIRSNARIIGDNGNSILLKNPLESEKYFNDHRDEYFQFIFEGLKFHFLGFLPNGIASKVNTLNLENLADLAM